MIEFGRRTVLIGPLALSACADGASMYGLVGKMRAHPGQRDALIAILTESTGAMPGCRLYMLATDPADADAIWITEVWDSPEHHTASLELPQVQAAIGRARPLLAGFGERFEMTPIGGFGLNI